MGLFSRLGKKKKQTQPQAKQASIGKKSVTDAGQRQAFYKECADLIDEAVLQTEQAKNEYGLVTSYLSDVDKVEKLRGEAQASVVDAAKHLIALEEEKAQLRKQQPGITDAQKGFFMLHEEEIPKKITWLRAEEERQRDLEGKLNYLAGEKSVYAMEHEDAVGKNRFLRNVVLGVAIVVFVFLVLFICVESMTEIPLRIPFLLTVIVGVVVAMYAFLETKKNIVRLKAADVKKNKVIEVENKIKLRHVNCTWGIEYAYEKYHAQSSGQLESMWREYLRIRAEEEQFRKNERQSEIYRNTIIAQLKKYGVSDTGIWVLQPRALLDEKEMVEVRHSLNVRRQKLREHIEYNAKQKDENENAILRFIRDYPEYAQETAELLGKYHLLKKL